MSRTLFVSEDLGWSRFGRGIGSEHIQELEGARNTRIGAGGTNNGEISPRMIMNLKLGLAVQLPSS
jgi:hypothetical protein